MTLTRAFFHLLTWTAAMLPLRCTADRLPPPTGLSSVWLDPLTVNVSWAWQTPSYLPEGCEIKFKFTIEGDKRETKRTESRHITAQCLTEESGSHRCTFTVQVDSPVTKLCNNWTSIPESITVVNKRQGKVVNNFRCVIDNSGLNCSWIPVNSSQNVTLSYRTCGVSEETRKPLEKCGQYYSSGQRNGCYLEVSGEKTEVCVHVETEIARSTFKVTSLVVPPPKLNITKTQHELKLTWKIPDVQNQCWNYQFNYTQCNKPVPGRRTIGRVNFFTIPYDEQCLYEIRSRVVSDENICPVVNSDWSDVVTYGSNRPPDGTLTVVAIIIPIILFVCVILSCYCFRKHINILCPIIPDPSAIFKEMMMNGNKDQRPGNLYTPVPEPVDSCNVTPVTENSTLP